MKWTLAHAPAALHALLEWYPLHDEVVSFLGERRAILFCDAISTETDCLICSTFFRRILIDAGEDPDALGLVDRARGVAEAVIFFVSDRARFITGSSLVLDAGLLTR